ncbi:MAG: ferrous iron transport protein B [Chlorobi bacterium]|nr:ferrous iron transport protein B [Chlorobiota bacterium]MCI0717025.1 ferrous iron transport protein B [Chlorobiota bacterium]
MAQATKAQNCHETGTLTEITNEKPVIALIGMPNSGKTTLFNSLTGSNFKTSNYPGATVEYSTGNLAGKYDFESGVLDSPGIVSLNPSSPDEEIAIDGLFNHPRFGLPNVVIITADSTQISRQLFLVKQVIDSGFKTIIALTMNDLLGRKGLEIDSEKLSEVLGIPVVKINSKKGTGLRELIEESKKIILLYNIEHLSSKIYKPSHPTEEAIAKLYDFTEETEQKVLIHNDKQVSIDVINKKVFRTLQRKPDENSMKLDKFFLHPFWGIIIFIISMGIIFTSIFWIAQPLMDLVDSAFSSLSSAVSNFLPGNTWYSDLITNGVINGFGSVMVFVPQIVILFILLGLLEDTGYLARAAMLIDRPLTKFGLNGRSFIPMLSGYACAIPAIMAARTISNRYERFLTIMIIPLMSCSARLPVYALLLAFLVPPSTPWIAGIGLGALYLFSLISGAVVAGIISKFKKTDEKSTFMLELPPYRTPVFRHIFKNTYYKSAVYVKQAGPTIIIISLLLWALTYFPNTSPQIETGSSNVTEQQINRIIESERLNTSYAATIGKYVFEPVLKPLGWDWRVGVSLISAFAAREVFVSAMAITFNITEDSDNSDNLQKSILTSMRNAKSTDGTQPLFTTASTIALIIYFMFAMQCLSTVAVARKETGSWKIPLMQIVVYTFMAYILAFITYNGLNLLGIR